MKKVFEHNGKKVNLHHGAITNKYRGIYYVTVELECDGNYDLFSTETNDTEVIDEYREVKDDEPEKGYEILYNHIKDDIEDLVIGWLTPIKALEKQKEYQEEMQKAGFNIIECYECSAVLIHKTVKLNEDEQQVSCYECGNDVSPNDCSDLFY